MALPSTLKRHDPSSNDNVVDSLDDDDDVTWGGKRPRFIYNFVLDDSPLSHDSDETESVHSSQSKSTMQLLSEVDISCDSSCSDYEYHSSESSFTEFDIRSSSSCNNIDSNISDSSTTMEYKAEENSTTYDKAILSSDIGYLPDDTDVQDSNWRVKWPPPACFRNCLQCGKANPNPFFQFCHNCFRHRKEYFEDKPDLTRKNNKLSSNHKKEENSLIEPDLPNSQESGYSSLLSSQEEKKNSEDFKIIEKNKSSKNLCNICLQKPKNGIFNHKKIGHIMSCYECAKKIWKRNGKCPVCNVKIKFVTKLIVV